MNSSKLTNLNHFIIMTLNRFIKFNTLILVAQFDSLLEYERILN